MLKIPENKQYVLFGGAFVLANKLQWVADKTVPGLSTKQWYLLRTLHDMPPAPTITALAAETDTTRQNVSKLLAALARQGCVELRANPADHRSQTVALTDHGRQMLGRMAAASKGFFEALFAGISAEESAVAAGVTIKLIENLFKMQEELP